VHSAERIESNKKLSCRRETARRFVSLNLNILLRHSRSLKVIRNEGVRKSLLVFQWHCVCMSYRFWDISVKEWRDGDLETGDRGHSRSLKMAPFDRLYTTFYWSAIVIIALSATFLSYLTLNDIMTLKSGLEITQGHLKWYHSKAWVQFPIRLP